MSILIIRDKTYRKFGFYINKTVLIISNTSQQVFVIRDMSITLYASNQELSSECLLDLEHPVQRPPVGQENNIKLTRRKNHYRWKTLIGDRIFICSNRDMYKQFLVQCFDEIKKAKLWMSTSQSSKMLKSPTQTLQKLESHNKSTFEMKHGGIVRNTIYMNRR